MNKHVCIIAGSDTSCGAGFQAGIKTLTALGVSPTCIPTAWTAQNTQRVISIECPSMGFLRDQFQAIREIGRPNAVVVGMLANEDVLNEVAEGLLAWKGVPLIVDPVIVSTSGKELLTKNAVSLLREKILPQAEILTPNLPELEVLVGKKMNRPEDWIQAGRELLAPFGPQYVWVKGGHQPGSWSQDLFLTRDQAIWFATPRKGNQSYHGTGCTLAAALAGARALGHSPIEAALFARSYLHRALRLAKPMEESSTETVFFHQSWPREICPEDLPVVHSQPFDSLPPPFATLKEKIGFYPVVDRADWVEKLVATGVRTIQLRAKDLSGEALKQEAIRSQKACEKYGAQFFLNDDWRLALELGCYGVHLGQEDLLEADMTALAQSGLRLGLSTHCLEELGRAVYYRPSYLALGPIFPTKLKAMRFAPQGIERLKLWKNFTSIPLVAIGGIQLEQADSLLEVGIDGIAVVNDVLSHPDPLGRTGAWIQKFRK